MSRGKTLILLASLLGAGSIWCLAQSTTQPAVDANYEQPDTRPTPPPSNTGEDIKPRRSERSRIGQKPPTSFDEKDRNDAMQFLKEHSPQRYKYVQSLPDGDRKTSIENVATRNYQNWMRLSKEDWHLYGIVLKRAEIEDDVFGLVLQIRSASPDARVDLRSQLHDKVSQLIDIGFKERQARLDTLTKTLKQEQQKLDTDEADKDTLIDKRLKSIESDERLFLPNITASPRPHDQRK